MTMTELPPLPMPSDLFCVKNGMGYSAEQMREYGRQCCRAGAEQMRERAAKEVVNSTDFAHEERDIWMQETIASVIRALPVE